jgi:hypothetical protein
MKSEYKLQLERLQRVIQDTANMAMDDQAFNSILWEMNRKANVFTRCMSDIAGDLQNFIEESEPEKEFIDGTLVYMGQVIEDPFKSPCLRYDVNPLEYYGLTKEELKQML